MRFNLQEWTRERLQTLEPSQQLAFAEEVAGSLVQRRVLLGRVLLAIQSCKSYEEWGASSVHHYASLKLGEDERDSRDALLVAQRLETLPLLTEAVEEDGITWCKLRAILRRATPETEARWLDLASRWNMRMLERFLREDAHGERGHHATSEAEMVQLHAQVSLQEMGLLQRAIRDLSVEAGKPLSLREAIECLAAERLSGRAFPDEKQWERLRLDVERDLEAKREREAPWEAAAATEEECPGAPELSLVQVAPVPHWSNERLDFNGDARGLTPGQRREILRRDGYACSVPDCPHKLWLEMHHVVFYCDGGATVPANLVCVCSRCHRHIHRGLLRVEGDAPRGLRWFDRHGRELGAAARERLTEPDGFAEEFLLWFDRMSQRLEPALSGRAHYQGFLGESSLKTCLTLSHMRPSSDWPSSFSPRSALDCAHIP